MPTERRSVRNTCPTWCRRDNRRRCRGEQDFQRLEAVGRILIITHAEWSTDNNAPVVPGILEETGHRYRVRRNRLVCDRVTERTRDVELHLIEKRPWNSHPLQRRTHRTDA